MCPCWNLIKQGFFIRRFNITKFYIQHSSDGDGEYMSVLELTKQPVTVTFPTHELCPYCEYFFVENVRIILPFVPDMSLTLHIA